MQYRPTGPFSSCGTAPFFCLHGMINSPARPLRRLRKARRSLSTAAGRPAGFGDFCELAYCAIAKTTEPDPERREALESRYMDTIGRYPPERAVDFREMLRRVHDALAKSPEDFLGTIYQDEGFTERKYGGQYFTPWPVVGEVGQGRMAAQAARAQFGCGPVVRPGPCSRDAHARLRAVRTIWPLAAAVGLVPAAAAASRLASSRTLPLGLRLRLRRRWRFRWRRVHRVAQSLDGRAVVLWCCHHVIRRRGLVTQSFNGGLLGLYHHRRKPSHHPSGCQTISGVSH